MGRALRLATTILERAQTFETSFVDYLEDTENRDPYPSSSDVAFDISYKNEYDDNYWNRNFEGKINGLTKLLNNNYYGWTKLF